MNWRCQIDCDGQRRQGVDLSRGSQIFGWNTHACWARSCTCTGTEVSVRQGRNDPGNEGRA